MKLHKDPTKKAFDCSVLIYVAIMVAVFAIGLHI